MLVDNDELSISDTHQSESTTICWKCCFYERIYRGLWIQDKKALAGNEAITNDVVGYAHVENFALKIFVNADNEDRADLSSK